MYDSSSAQVPPQNSHRPLLFDDIINTLASVINENVVEAHPSIWPSSKSRDYLFAASEFRKLRWRAPQTSAARHQVDSPSRPEVPAGFQ